MELPIFATTSSFLPFEFLSYLQHSPKKELIIEPTKVPKNNRSNMEAEDTPWIFKDRMWNETETEISVCVEKPTHPASI